MTPHTKATRRLEIPKIGTPAGVVDTLGWIGGSLIVVLAIIGGILGASIANEMSTAKGLAAGIFLGVAAALAIIKFNDDAWAHEVPQYHTAILLNIFTKKQRAIFQGFNYKLPWETIQLRRGESNYIDLRVDLRKPVHDEPYPAKDALMRVSYVYAIRPNYSDPVTASDNMVLFASYEMDAIDRSGKAMITKLLSDYYGPNIANDLLNKTKIEYEVLETGDGEVAVEKFEKNHGVEFEIELENSVFDTAAQQFRDMISKASSFSEAVAVLRDKGNMDQTEAERVAKLMNFSGVQEFNLNVTAPDLQGLHTVVIGGAGEMIRGDKKTKPEPKKEGK